MSRLVFAFCCLAAWLIVGASAFADTAPAAATVAVLPAYQAAEPFLLTAFGVVFSALFGWGLTIFEKKTGIAASADMRAKVQDAATNAAGRVLAGMEGDVSKIAIPVGSPLIAAEVAKVTAAVPDALSNLGVTPASVANIIAGKIGVLQASAAATPTVKIGA